MPRLIRLGHNYNHRWYHNSYDDNPCHYHHHCGHNHKGDHHRCCRHRYGYLEWKPVLGCSAVGKRILRV
jgi:hypothetical protein